MTGGCCQNAILLRAVDVDSSREQLSWIGQMSLRLFVMRHGETAWSRSGQHTGRADIPLTEHGEHEARQLGTRIRDIKFAHVLTSPLQRAKHTCTLAGQSTDATTEPDLVEWDNGDYEGQTPQQILAINPGWNLFRDGCPGGECPSAVVERVDRLVRSLRSMDGDIALFTHGHLGRVLAARWLGLPVESAEHFLFGTAALSVLAYLRDQVEVPVIALWNSSPVEALTAVPQASSIPPILTINGGSSSIKFAILHGSTLARTLSGKVDRIGSKAASFEFTDALATQPATLCDEIDSFPAAVKFLIDWLDERVGLTSLAAVGHRVVHGMLHTEPQLVTDDLLVDLHKIVACDPQHLPGEIALIEALRARLPDVPQFACFDTGFHATMPRVAKLLAIPRRFDRLGVQRFGFHGLSYAFLLHELIRIGDPAAVIGRVILAHLGNGASLCAVRDGQSIETTMGFTPAAGLPMSTRSGDLDPGLMGYLARTEQMTVNEFDQMVNHESGLLGVSELSSDMRELIELEAVDIRAAEAVELFCYQTKKSLGALVAALGGLQTLVFSGGIGENAPEVRARICAGQSCFGIELNALLNKDNAAVISSANSSVTVRVIRTDEEQMIARSVMKMLEANHA